jgi:cytidylate kinase
MTVITMSRQIGSGSEELGQRLCQELRLIVFNKQLMARVANDVGISSGEIVDYSEEEYQRRGFFEALFRRSRPVAEFSTWVGSPVVGYERRTRLLDEVGAIDLIRATVQKAYEHGDTLIVGRGGQVILEDKPNVLHVRVVAPFEARVRRMQESQNMTPAQARRYLQETDSNSAEYLRSFFHVDPDDASLYHLIVNTERLGVEGALALIKKALEVMPEGQPTLSTGRS